MEGTAESFAVGDICIYAGQLCVVEDIAETPLGFRRYSINNVDSGESINVQRHSIAKPEIEILDDGDINWDNEIVMQDTSEPRNLETTTTEHVLAPIDTNVQQEPVQLNKTRHAQLTDDDIDNVAKQRLSVSTKNQTRWAVNVLRG